MGDKKKIVIVGGGFAGVYTAMHLESLLKRNNDYEIIIINRENYFVYQPMLAEVVGGSLGILDTVNSLQKLIPSAHLYIREICGFDLEKKRVEMVPKYTHEYYYTEYDHLVFAGGNVTDFRGAPGLHEHALPFKNLADSLRIRNRIIDVIATASTITEPELRQQFLTFVVGGGGFSGTEVVAEVNDFARRLAKQYPSINPKEIKVVMIHSKDRLMERELSESLSRYSEKILKKRGVEILFDLRLQAATEQRAILSNGESIPSRTVISTVPSSPNPIFESLNLPMTKGKFKTDGYMQIEGSDHLWAIGDCAMIPLGEDKFCPPTAQFAVREGKVLAQNIVATLRNKEKKLFHFKALGMLGALGHHNAVAEFFGKIKVSGIIAWIMWRTIYWMKLPGISRKIKVALSWMLDVIIPIENIELKIESTQAIAQLHFEKDEIIFHEGDLGDYLYIIIDGQVDILKQKDGKETSIATLNKGEFFGEMALLNERKRTATIKCLTPTNVLALRKSDFGMLIANFAGLKHQFESAGQKREESH